MLRAWLNLAFYVGAGSLFITLLSATVPRQHPGIALEYREVRQDRQIVNVYYLDIERGIRSSQQKSAVVETLKSSNTAPDGRRVLSLPTPGNIDLFLVAPDTNRFQLTHFKNFPPLRANRDSRRANLYPLWSPDAAWIIFLSSDEVGHLDLYAIRPDGSDMRVLAYRIHSEDSVYPRWVILKSSFWH